MSVRPVTALCAALFCAGCSGSGFWTYERNTLTLPGANPNAPTGTSETYQRVRAQPSDPAPLLTEAGDVWPPLTKKPPTLQDLQRQQNAQLSGNTGTGALSVEATAPLPPLPQLPGYAIAAQPDARRASPAQTFPGGLVPLPGGRPGVLTGGGEGFQTLNGPTGNGSIVVPNGNGTSTVIGPNGTVTTVPTPPK